MNTKIIISLVVVLFMVQACYDDKGNYDYLPTNRVTFALEPPTRTAYLGEIYHYDPGVRFADPGNTEGFAYWWEYTGSSASGGAYDTICKTRALYFHPQEAGEVWVRLCVRELSTGFVTTSPVLALNVQSPFGKGWMILGKRGERTTLSFVRPGYQVVEGGNKIRTYTSTIGLYDYIFPKNPLGTAPVQLRQMLTYDNGAILIVQGSGPVYLNGNSYKKEVLLSDEFTGGAPKDLVVKEFYNGTNVDIVLDSEGKMYVRNFMNIQGVMQPLFTREFMNIPYRYKGQELHIERVIPTRPMHDRVSGLYDAEHDRLLWAGVYQNASIEVVIPSMMSTAETEYMDLTNFKGWKLVYCGAHSGSSVYGQPHFIALFSKEGEVRVQTFTAKPTPAYNATTVSITDVKMKEFSGKEYISDRTKYYALKTRAYLFFAEKNGVYWYDLTTGKTHLFYTFADTKASVVAMSSNPQESELGVVLDNGTFATLNIKNEKLYAGEQIYEKSGFGEVIDLDYKFPNYSVYSNRMSASNAD